MSADASLPLGIERVAAEQGRDRPHPNWDELYRQVPSTALPWYNPDLDDDLARALTARGITSGRFLDVGTGPGTQAAALAQRGFAVTGTDVSPTAIALARQVVAADVALLVDDILDSKLSGSFDYVLDCGCLHVLAATHWPVYVRTLTRLLRPGGLLFLKCFSTAEPEVGFGPQRFDRAGLARTFSPQFGLIEVVDTLYRGPRAHQPQALFAILERLP